MLTMDLYTVFLTRLAPILCESETIQNTLSIEMLHIEHNSILL